MKYVLVCINHGCPMDEISVPTGAYTMKYNHILEEMVPKLNDEDKKLCSTCGEPLVFKKEKVDIPSFSVNGFKGLSDEKKKEVLRKRFDVELKGDGGDEKEFRKKNAISKMVGYDK